MQLLIDEQLMRCLSHTSLTKQQPTYKQDPLHCRLHQHVHHQKHSEIYFIKRLQVEPLTSHKGKMYSGIHCHNTMKRMPSQRWSFMLEMMSNTSMKLPIVSSTLQRGLILFKKPRLKEESMRAAPKTLVSITIELGTNSTAGAHASQNFLLIVHAITYANMKGSKSIPLAAYRAWFLRFVILSHLQDSMW